MNTVQRLSAPLGRLLIALIFVTAGVGKIGNYAGTQGYMESMGVPGMLLPLVFYGGGRLSLDHVLLKITGRDTCVTDRIGDGIAAALMFAVLGVTTIWVEPSWGITFLVAALIVGLVPALRR